MALSYASIALVFIQGFVLTPMYLARIPIALYGAWLATGSVLAWIELADPGMAVLVQQRVAFAYGRRDSRELSTVIGSGLLVAALLSALPLAAIPLASGIPSFVNLPGDMGRELVVAFRLGVVSLTLTLVSNTVGGVNAGLQRAVASGTIGLAGTAVGVVASLSLLLAGARLNSIPAGFIARAVFILIANGFALRYWLTRHLPEGLRVSRNEATALLHLSTFGFVGRLGATLLQRLDSFLSARLISPAAAAVLTLTGRPFDIVRMASDRIAGGLLAPIAHLAGEGGAGRLREVTVQMVAVASWLSAAGLGLMVAFNRIFVQLWVGSDLYGGDALSVAIAAATAVTIQAVLFGQLVYGLGGVRLCSVVVLIEALVRIPLQLFLGQRFGLIGLPLSTVATSLGITLVLLPLAAEPLVGAKRGELLRLAWLRIGLVGIVAAIGVPLRHALALAPVRWSWPTFGVAVALVGIGFLGVLIVVDGGLRVALRRLLWLRWVPRRAR